MSMVSFNVAVVVQVVSSFLLVIVRVIKTQYPAKNYIFDVLPSHRCVYLIKVSLIIIMRDD